MSVWQKMKKAQGYTQSVAVADGSFVENVAALVSAHYPSAFGLYRLARAHSRSVTA